MLRSKAHHTRRWPGVSGAFGATGRNVPGWLVVCEDAMIFEDTTGRRWRTTRRALTALCVVVGYVAALYLSAPLTRGAGANLPVSTILFASSATLARLAIAYALAALCALPLALLATSSPRIEYFALPLFDVFESVPILVLFPVLTLIFVQSGFLNGAAIAILFLTMLWSIVFTIIGGIKIIPRDILFASRMFGLSRISEIRRVVIPAIIPQFVTGSILALAQGWNIVIVAEVLHTYIPNGTAAQDLFGIGSILVASSAEGSTGIFIESVIAMVAIIAFFNFFAWQPLLNYAQRFRFD